MKTTIEALEYYKLLSRTYPSIQEAAAEIVNLSAILNLPKGTEHFLSDIHGEFNAFNHMIRSGSGLIRNKIDETFPSMSVDRKKLLSTIIYYPKEKIDYMQKNGSLDRNEYSRILSELIDVAKVVTSKYTRLKIRKLISPNYIYIMEELLESHQFTMNKEEYYKEIIDSIIDIGQANEYIEEICHLIQNASVERLHILGDIFDRGGDAFHIMELLEKQKEVDITWGNHDVLYMGAYAGNLNCIATVIRNSCRYNTLSTIEESYGISLRPLVTFASRTYRKDDCKNFIPRVDEANINEDYDTKIIAKMHKAITIIQMKLDGQFTRRHKNYKADILNKLEHIDFIKGTYIHENKEYSLTDPLFETVDPTDCYKLTVEEEEVMEKLQNAFHHSRKLKEHVLFLLSHGSMYQIYNSNLLYHGLIPVDDEGEFLTYKDELGKTYKGRTYLDYCDKQVRRGILRKEKDIKKESAIDFYYFLWCCYLSPLYGKKDIVSFESYFLSSEDKKDFKETKSPYYELINKKRFVSKLLKEFGIEKETSVIINGHMPVKIRKGETPLKAGGKLIIIDGGICQAYHKVTGIAGYTLTSNSHGMNLIAHDVFVSKEKAIKDNEDIVNSIERITTYDHRMMVKETDHGMELEKKVEHLKELVECYRMGLIKSK